VEFSCEEIDGAALYVVDVISGQSGTQTGTRFLVEGLSAGDEVEIEVFAIGGGVCGNSSSTQSCIAAACPNDVTVVIDPVAPLCLDASASSITLSANITNANGNGNITWTGRGITDAVDGIFDPTNAGLGIHTVRAIYQEANCSYEESIDIEVVAPPTASFTVDDMVCVNDIAVVTYTGNTSANATYNWNFDGGVSTNGNGADPGGISWATSGEKTITLTVTEGGCTAELFSESVMVTEPIMPPTISCASAPTSIQFSWEEVASASDYEVAVLSGPTGTLNGNTYLVEGLDPGDEVIIELTVVSNDPCGNVSSEAFSCTAEPCDPINATISGDMVICEGDEAMLIFDFEGANGTFDVVVEDELNNTFTIENILDGHREIITPLQSSSYRIVSAIANLNTVCPVTVNGVANVTVDPPLKAGSSTGVLLLCTGLDTLIALDQLLTGADTGGDWAETSLVGSTGGAFSAGDGTFSPNGQIAGSYSFAYTVRGNGPCGEDVATVVVELSGGPVADAGADRELDCDFTPVMLDGSGSGSGNNLSYRWSGPENITSVNESLQTDVAGVYQLEVTDLDTGCSSIDEVEVRLNDEVPSDLGLFIIDPACEGDEFGRLLITGVEGGVGPYVYALEEADFSAKTDYENLLPGAYQLTVQDAKGCEFSTSFEVSAPAAFNISLGPDQEINFGDSLTLRAEASQQVETIRWSPFAPTDCSGTECLDFLIKPQNTTIYRVEAVSANGCRASDDVRIVVNKDRKVFFPTGFSPEGDVANRIFYIHSDQGVRKVNQFNIYSRWGDLVFSASNFAPNNPEFGWNGEYRGQEMNAGVFAYIAEVEFLDGTILVYQGEVTLIR
ncbi:MAG: gliding motility-associated C-terminal domain-containing protein, partial [Bacteroidota bacterium]